MNLIWFVVILEYITKRKPNLKLLIYNRLPLLNAGVRRHFLFLFSL